MSSNVVAIKGADGRWMPPTQPQQKTNNDVVDVSMSDVDQIVAHLGAVVRLAQNLSESDARRVRDFIHATSAALTMSTYFREEDQAKFEQALRGR